MIPADTSEKSEETPKTGQEKLLETAKVWSSGLSTYSVQATYAIIGANWAVHGGTDKILTNSYAIWSIAICVAFISVNILLTGVMTEWLFRRWTKAENKPNWWSEEYKKRADTKWPYTKGIENLGFSLRLLKIAVPILAGVLFILSLI